MTMTEQHALACIIMGGFAFAGHYLVTGRGPLDSLLWLADARRENRIIEVELIDAAPIEEVRAWLAGEEE